MTIVLAGEKAAAGHAVARKWTLEHKEQDEADDNCSEDEILVGECVHSLVQDIADIDQEMAQQRRTGNDNNLKDQEDQRELPYDHS